MSIIIENGQITSIQNGHQITYYVGIDANKSSSPGVGDMYNAYDTGKEYTCFTAGTWTYNPKYMVGLDANKSASPSVGDFYKASDTLREYVCMATGVWTFIPQYRVGLDADKTETPVVGEKYNTTDTAREYVCTVAGTWTLIPQYHIGLDADKSATPLVGERYKASDTYREYVCIVAGTWVYIPQSRTGLDADKTSSPIVGEGYKATDTCKEYTCYTVGIWTLISSPCVEAYYNHRGENDNVMSPFGVGGVGGTGAPHKFIASSGDGINNMRGWQVTIPFNPATAYFKFNAKIHTIVNGVGGNNVRSFIGIFDDPKIFSVGPTGVYFKQNIDNTWLCDVCDTFSGAIEVPITSLVAGDDITIIGQKNRMLFFVNGVLVANIQNYIASVTSTAAFLCQTEDASVTTERELHIDNISIEVMK